MLTELLIAFGQDWAGRWRDTKLDSSGGSSARCRCQIRKLLPFFALQASIGAQAFAVDSPRHEHSPGMRGFSKQPLSSTICVGRWKIPPTHRGGRNRRQRRLVGLFFNVFGLKSSGFWWCESGSVEPRFGPRRHLELECQHFLGSHRLQCVPPKRSWRALHQSELVGRYGDHV